MTQKNPMKKISHLEQFFLFHLQSMGYNHFIQEYRFAAIAAGGTGKGVRKRLNAEGLKDWRFDFADPENMVAVEIEGGIFCGGRHVTGVGYAADCQKYNAAVILGWQVLRFTSLDIKRGTALLELEKLYKVRIKAGTCSVPPFSLSA